jgi:hypothetical protein
LSANKELSAFSIQPILTVTQSGVFTMKRLLIASIVTIVSAVGLSSAASAGTYSPKIDQREANQQGRIFNGVRSGALTPKETYRLEKQQASIRAQEAQFKSNGNLSKRERHILNHRLNKASNAIYNAKHNGRHY